MDHPSEIESQKQENEALQRKYNQLNDNYNVLQSDYNKMVERLTVLEKQTPVPDENKSSCTTPLPTLTNEVSSMKNDALKNSQSISELQDFFSYVDNKLAAYTIRLDEIEQYMRLYALLIHGLDDVPVKTYGVEFSEYVLKKLQSLLPSIANKLKLEDIDVSHPLPTKKKSIVIVKFVRRDIRNMIFYGKRELKNSRSKVSITEHLTKRNLWLMDEAKKIVGYKNVWSSQCTVFALVNGHKIKVKNSNDLSYVHQSLHKVAHARNTSVDADMNNPPLNNSECQSGVLSDPRNKDTANIFDTLSQITNQS